MAIMERLPALNSPLAWFKVLGILFLLVMLNAVVFMVTYMAGIIVTLPLTLFLAFLLLRDLLPRHRFPRGAPRKEIPE